MRICEIHAWLLCACVCIENKICHVCTFRVHMYPNWSGFKMVQNQCARSKITAKETPKSPNESEAEPDLHLSQIQVITRDSEMV